MSLYDDLRKKLTPEQFTSVTDALGDDFDYDVVPRSRLNKVIKQRNEWKEKAEGVAQPTAPAGKEDDDDDFTDDHGKGKSNPATGKAKPVDEAALRAQFEQEKQRMRIEFAALNALRGMDALDPELALTQIDLADVKLENGKLVGFDDKASALKESKSFLFKATRKRSDAAGGTGKEGGDEGGDNGGVSTIEDFMKLSTQDQLAFKEAHPDTFKRFLGSV